jgi:hypothetical protein
MMRHRNDPVELIRNTNPVPDAHQLPDETQASFEALFEEIIGMEHQEPTTTRNHHRPRIGRITALAAAFVVLSAGVAIAAGIFNPDPADVATIEDDGAQSADVHLDGWRPELKTEAVWCMVDEDSGADTMASEFPLGDPLTMEILLAECSTGNDVARNLDSPPTDFTVCEATFTDQSYQERISVDDRFNVVEGDLAGDRPGFPVVLAWKADCATTQLDTSWDVDLAPLESLDDINQAREAEVTVRATALNACLSIAEARAMAASSKAELGAAWLLVEYEPEAASDCYTVDIDLQWGTIMAISRDDGTPAGPDDSTEPKD